MAIEHTLTAPFGGKVQCPLHRQKMLVDTMIVWDN